MQKWNKKKRKNSEDGALLFYSRVKELHEEESVRNYLRWHYHFSTIYLEMSMAFSTTTENGVNFTLKAKQGVTEGPIQTSVEGRFYDRKEGVSLSQSWSNQNRLNTRIEFSKIAPGWKGDVNAFLTPQSIKNAKFNLSYAQKSFAARTSIDILQPKDFVGSVTLAHRGFVGGTEIAYDTAAGLCARCYVNRVSCQRIFVYFVY